MDAAFFSSKGVIAFEWETGNISSSHRSMNKMCLGLLTQKIIAGFLVIPSKKLYPYLTDRIGNFPELEPYLPSISCVEGVLEIIVIEQDAESFDVPKIPKGTDGRAFR
jgi:Restriction endonuclease BamHI